MKPDPIVEEIRKAGNDLCESKGNNLHDVCEYLRVKGSMHAEKVVSLNPKKKIPIHSVQEGESQYRPEE